MSAIVYVLVKKYETYQYFLVEKGILFGTMAVNKALIFNQNVLIYFLFLHKNIGCGTHHSSR